MYFESEFITQDQLAKMLGISKVTIWRMIRIRNSYQRRQVHHHITTLHCLLDGLA